MSIESVAIALHHSRSRGTAKLVLLGIANHDGDGGAFPKVATLAKYANVHPRRVVEALNKLGELGEIIIHQQEGGTRNTPDALRPNRYDFVLECPEDCDRTKHHRITGERIGRSYAGQFDPERDKDPAAVERGRKARATLIARREAVENTTLPPSDESVPSVGNSTTPSVGNSTTPSDGNSTTKNHQIEPPVEPRFVSTSPGRGPAVDTDQLPCRKCKTPAPAETLNMFGLCPACVPAPPAEESGSGYAKYRAARKALGGSKAAGDDK